MERPNAWKSYTKKQVKELEKLNKHYLEFLSTCKTERECVKEIVRQAEAAGYVNLDKILASKKSVKAGDKVYAVCMKKTIAL
ncbi:MAG: aminopeptidase, partial [Lachnospiraceae bacterium]|nr:aminopeptidase [Lachnospiraceae bacterium]